MPTFAAFLLAYLLSQFFRSFLAVIAPDLGAELGLGPADLGSISAAWFAAFALAQFPVGSLLDRYGPRRTASVIMISAAAGSALFAAAHDAITCIVAMALIGIGCAPIYMGALYYFGRTFRPERFALLSSWLLAIGSLGNLLAATPLALLAASIGWRSTFLWVAGLTLASALLVWIVVRDPPRVTAPVTTDGKSRSAIAELASIRVLWPILPLVLVSYAVIAAERGLWLGPFLTQVYGLDAVGRGNAALAMAIAMSTGALAYGPLDQLFGTRKWVVFVGSMFTTACFLVLGLVPQLSIEASVAVLTVAGFAGLTYGVLMAHGRSFLPDHLLGRGITLLNFLFIGGAFALQIGSGHLVAAMTTGGQAPAAAFAMLHLLFGCLLGVATLLYLVSSEKRQAP